MVSHKVPLVNKIATVCAIVIVLLSSVAGNIAILLLVEYEIIDLILEN